MSCGISGDKKVLKFANTSDRGLVCLSSLFAKCTVQGLNRPTYDPSYKVRLRRVRLQIEGLADCPTATQRFGRQVCYLSACLGFDVVTPERVGDIAGSLLVLSATINI